MVTRIKRQDGGIDRIVTQQYEVGLYVAVYDDKSGMFKDQFALECKEEDYHRFLREECKDNIVE